ncbi:MAG: glycosyltransferase, partial [Methanobacterium sp.]
VVENSPEDTICNYIKQNYPWVQVIKNENNGFGEGNNTGAKAAKGKYLLFLNPDTVFVEPIFKFATDKFELDSNLALFGVKLVNRDLTGNMSFYNMDRYGILYFQFIKLCNLFDIYIDGKMFIAGADLFVKKADFIACGMFDEKIFMYNEEPDLTKRLRSKKKKTAYYKDKKIIHLMSQTITKDAALRKRLVSLKYYCDKYGNNFTKIINSYLIYEYMKMIIFFFVNKTKFKTSKDVIMIYKEFK